MKRQTKKKWNSPIRREIGRRENVKESISERVEWRKSRLNSTGLAPNGMKTYDLEDCNVVNDQNQ